jgi:hypothetical protein
MARALARYGHLSGWARLGGEDRLAAHLAVGLEPFGAELSGNTGGLARFGVHAERACGAAGVLHAGLETAVADHPARRQALVRWHSLRRFDVAPAAAAPGAADQEGDAREHFRQEPLARWRRRIGAHDSPHWITVAPVALLLEATITPR